jgi:uncharacterized membrane protein YccC
VAATLRTHPLPRFADWLSLSREARFSIRFAVAATLALWIGKDPGLVGSHSSWILITVLMLVQPTGGASLLKSLLRGAGTIAAAFTAIGLFGLFAQNPPLLMASFFLTQAVGAYGFTGPRFQYAWFVFAFTTAIVLGDAMSTTNLVETVAFERASMVGIGILLVYVVDALLSNARAEEKLGAGLAASARSLAAALERAILDPTDERQESDPLPEPGTFTSQLAALDAARTEIGTSREKLARLERAAAMLEALAALTRSLRANALARNPEGGSTPLPEAIRELASRVLTALNRIADALEAPDNRLLRQAQLDEALRTFERERSGTEGAWTAADETRLTALRDVVAVVRELEEALGEATPGIERTTERPPRKAFQVDPFRMKIAIRSGIAVVVALVIPAILGWPMNTTVAPVSFMMAATPTRGGMAQQLGGLVRALAIAWVVADLLIVFVTPHLARAPLAMLPPFAVALVFAYIGSRFPRLAPLSSIGGLVVFLSAYGGTSAAMGVEAPYDTVCYFGVALAVGVLAGRLLWPATASQLFRQRVAAQLDLCLEEMAAARESQPEAERPSRLMLIERFSAQSAQLTPLHAQANLEPVERGLGGDLRTRLQALAREMFDALIADQSAALAAADEHDEASLRSVDEAMHRSDEALRTSLRTCADAIRTGVPARSPALSQAAAEVEELLRGLEGGRDAPAAGPENQRARTLGRVEARRRLLLRQRAIEEWLAAWHDAQQPAGARLSEAPA